MPSRRHRRAARVNGRRFRRPVQLSRRLDRGVEPGERPLAAEGDERVEQRRRRRPAGRRDPDRHEQVAGLPAARLGELAQRRLELVGLPASTRVDARRGSSRAAASPSRVVAASQRFGTRSAGSTSRSSIHRKPTRSTIAARVGSRSWTTGQERPDLVVRRQPVDPAVVDGGLEERPEPVDEVVGLEPADPLPVQPLEPVRDRTLAPPFWTLSMSNRSMISSSERTSSSVPGLQPRIGEVVDRAPRG